MRIKVFSDVAGLASAAAEHAAAAIRKAIEANGTARIVAASAASQIAFLEKLVRAPGIDWERVEMFHLDEYIGLPRTHPASFCRFLLDRLIGPTGIRNYHLLDGTGDPEVVAQAAGEAIAEKPIDVAFVGIGENSHLAFNDPPANYETNKPFILLGLDEMCRRQQVSEGWFPTLEDVPTSAISMSIRQILNSQKIIAIVPDLRKAAAVRACLEEAIGPMRPASILRTHAKTTLYLDRQSASMLTRASL